MVALTQYPHFLYVQQWEDAKTLANGDLMPGVVEWKLWSVCREETNGKGTLINTADKRAYKFSSLIQLPTDCGRVEDGTMVIAADEELNTDRLTEAKIEQLKRQGVIRIMGESAKFDKGRLHCRLWV